MFQLLSHQLIIYILATMATIMATMVTIMVTIMASILATILATIIAKMTTMSIPWKMKENPESLENPENPERLENPEKMAKQFDVSSYYISHITIEKPF